MFTCKTHLRRSIRSLVILDLQTAQSEALSPSPTSPLCITSTRSHATIASIQKNHHLKLLRQVFHDDEQILRKKREQTRGPSLVSQRNERARENNKRHLDIRKEGDDDGALVSKYTSNQALQTELKWAGRDALKLAQSVLAKLRVGDAVSAMDLVRLSEKIPGVDGQKAVDSVVSWNHIMDYYMNKSLTREAFKVFNEMKKRGHKPDAHTYTIMLRGYTMHHMKHNAVEEAMKVYDSMWRPESTVKPSIIHSNAIINCLGRALNMDALWSVAGRLPERGPGAADKWTYTTILNTMQACAVRDAQQLAETDGNLVAAAKVIQQAIGEARRLWEDIISRWRSGDVNIDQTLVCAMGRLLLLGQKHDWDDIFSLVEQTMRVPRAKPPHIRRSTENSEELENALAVPPAKHDNGTLGLEQLEMAVVEEAIPQVKNEFAVVDLSDRPVRGRSGSEMPSPYANVGNNVLSLLVEASIKLREISAGKMYWERLTNSENEPFVMPDDDNFHSYLRLLRISRSSKEVCDLLRKPASPDLQGTWYKRGTFVIAMSTCARDFKNPNVFTYASTILDLMQANLEEPDLKVMTMYLSLALVTTPGVSAEIRGEFNARAGANNLIRAVQRFSYSDLDYRILVAKWSEKYGSTPEDDGEPLKIGLVTRPAEKQRNQKCPSHRPPEELIEFLQLLNSAYDKLLTHRHKMTEQMAGAFSSGRRELSQELQRINPDPLPPSREMFRKGEPADTLMEHAKLLRSVSFPDAVGRRGNRKIKGPRVVDLDKRHPFTRDREQSDRQGSRSEGRPDSLASRRNDQEGAASSSVSEGWSRAWKKSVEKMDKAERRKDWVLM